MLVDSTVKPTTDPCIHRSTHVLGLEAWIVVPKARAAKNICERISRRLRGRHRIGPGDAADRHAVAAQWQEIAVQIHRTVFGVTRGGVRVGVVDRVPRVPTCSFDVNVHLGVDVRNAGYFTLIPMPWATEVRRIGALPGGPFRVSVELRKTSPIAVSGSVSEAVT